MLRIEGVTKVYPGTVALDNVSVSFSPGKIHALLGKNGAGKSTPVKIIAGTLEPTEGKLYIDDRELDLHSAEDAFKQGIATVYQEMSLVPGLTIAENIFIGRMPRKMNGLMLDWPTAFRRAVAVICSLIVGFLVGWFTGWVRVVFRVPTFIITLAWMSILRGCCFLITGGFSIISFPPWYDFLGGGYIWGDIPFPAVILVIVFIFFYFLANYTSFGRSVYAIGGNAEAARLSGIRVGRITKLVLATVTVMATFAGVMQSSQIMAGSPNTATGWEMDVIAAVIIGGTSLAGGVGSVLGTFIGIIFLGIVVNGMTLLDMNEYWQFVARGVLIFGAVLINMAPANKNK
jgi:Ribose/xylose/arabinose/galactoside ABC-type transport systems, permease components